MKFIIVSCSISERTDMNSDEKLLYGLLCGGYRYFNDKMNLPYRPSNFALSSMLNLDYDVLTECFLKLELLGLIEMGVDVDGSRIIKVNEYEQYKR